MENKHTQGTWIVENNEILVKEEKEFDGDERIAEVFYHTFSNKEEPEANARAIVTAVNNTYGKNINPDAVPDLLEGCKWAVDVIKKLGEEGKYPEFLLARNGGDGIMPLLNAINKATKK